MIMRIYWQTIYAKRMISLLVNSPSTGHDNMVVSRIG